MSMCRKPRVSFALLLAFLISSACKIKTIESDPEPPPRPQNVPSDAVWAGGLDGGSFIVMKALSKPNWYSAQIYSDATGDLVFQGTLALDQESGPVLDLGDPKALDGWDGDTLHLRDGRSLSIRRLTGD